jgi:hypothetical protein
MAAVSLTPAWAAELKAGTGLATYDTKGELYSEQACVGGSCGTDLTINTVQSSADVTNIQQVDSPSNSGGEPNNNTQESDKSCEYGQHGG